MNKDTLRERVLSTINLLLDAVDRLENPNAERGDSLSTPDNSRNTASRCLDQSIRNNSSSTRDTPLAREATRPGTSLQATLVPQFMLNFRICSRGILRQGSEKGEKLAASVYHNRWVLSQRRKTEDLDSHIRVLRQSITQVDS